MRDSPWRTACTTRIGINLHRRRQGSRAARWWGQTIRRFSCTRLREMGKGKARLVGAAAALMFIAHGASAGAQTSWPTSATTGVPPGTTLRSCGGSATLGTSNQIIDGCTYTGDVTVTGSNVTIRNSRLYGQVWTSGN